MKHIILKLLLLANSILLVLYMGLAINMNMQSGIREIIAILLSSFLLVDATYISACNIRGNKTISLFCALLALISWYILLAASSNAITDRVFSTLSPMICCVSINFMLMFLFQGSGYKFQKASSLCLTGSCICSLLGLLVSEQIFALCYGIQLLASWLGFVFVVAYHRKRTAFVVKAEWKSFLFTFVTVTILFLAYCFLTRGVRQHLSNFGIYLPALLFSMSIHSIMLKEHSSFPLSTIFSKCQLALLLLFGAMTCGWVARAFGRDVSLFLLMLDILFVFVYACNIALDFNLRQGKNKIIRESKYHAVLQQLQREEQLNLEFANFLHDEILQDLLSVKNMMHRADRPDVQKMITETLDYMNTYIREQMQDYHPALLPKLTVKENYQNLLAYLSQAFPHRTVCIAFDCSDSLFLVAPYNLFVYRLLRELVTNVYKHSTGENAWIRLAQDKGIIMLCVRDDGTADANALLATHTSKHRGLALIAERVHSLDGTVTISNYFPHGICIEIMLPMKGEGSYQYFVSR